MGSATATIPAGRPSTATNTGVCPWVANRSASAWSRVVSMPWVSSSGGCRPAPPTIRLPLAP